MRLIKSLPILTLALPSLCRIGFAQSIQAGNYYDDVAVSDKTLDMTGTSMACPHVAGIAALILQRNPSLGIADVREIIAKSAYKTGDKPYNINKEYKTETIKKKKLILI